MRYLLPALLFAAFAAIVVATPHLEPQRLRARARRVGEQLPRDHGFRAGSKAAWDQALSSGWPPFHYGKRRATDGELIGVIGGLTARVAGYECVDTGWRHRYGLACVLLPAAQEWVEVRGEAPYSSARVPEHVPDGRVRLGVPEFDGTYQVFAADPGVVASVRAGQAAALMLAAPTAFSWRVQEGELLVWKRDGWQEAVHLIAAVTAALGVLGIEAGAAGLSA